MITFQYDNDLIIAPNQSESLYLKNGLFYWKMDGIEDSTNPFKNFYVYAWDILDTIYCGGVEYVLYWY